jgi:hypothetical protein
MYVLWSVNWYTLYGTVDYVVACFLLLLEVWVAQQTKRLLVALTCTVGKVMYRYSTVVLDCR